MKNIIEAKELSKKYNGFELDKISFTVKEGSIVGLIGENGAGKTTTIKAILNMINANGEIKIFGKDVKSDEKNIKKKIGVVLDDSFLSEYLTTKNINTIMKELYDDWSEEKYKNYIEEFKLPANKIVKEFSSGMKMKLKIICAISHNPQLLILDEPTSGLDPIIRNEILDIFRKFIQEDETRAILISTHITSDLEHISDYIIFIDNGKIILNAETNDIIENYGVVKCTKEQFEKIDKKDYEKYKKEKYQCELLVKDKYKFRNKYNINTIDKPSIEDIMLFFVKGGQIK